MFRKQRPPVGAQPGAMVAEESSIKPRIHVIEYTPEGVVEADISVVSELVAHRTRNSMSWVDVQGLGDHTLLKELAEVFGIHPLAIADVANIPSRPKVEHYDDVLFIITTMITRSEGIELIHEQVSIFVGKGFVLTFQERYGDVFQPVRERLRGSNGTFRKNGADYLAYALLDAIIDGYYPVLEALGEYLEEIEEEVIENPQKKSMHKIYTVKRQLLALRRAIWPQRESLSVLTKDDTKLISKNTRLHLRDCYDHCIQALDVVETYREICSGIADLYLSSTSIRMNEAMKVLTIIATIFIPLSFITGVYGMNFDYMPELRYREGYFVFWGVILVVTATMLGYFLKKGWIDIPFRKEKTEEVE